MRLSKEEKRLLKVYLEDYIVYEKKEGVKCKDIRMLREGVENRIANVNKIIKKLDADLKRGNLKGTRSDRGGHKRNNHK